MEKDNHIIIEIPEAKLDIYNEASRNKLKEDFIEIQNKLEAKPNPTSPAYYTWFWFFMKYGRALCSEEAQTYFHEKGLTPFTFVKDVVGLTMSGGGAYTIGYKFYDECLKNSSGVNVGGIKIQIDVSGNEKTVLKEGTNSSYRQWITAIRTKPFLLLAGISGTGKSRIVREFAFKTCPKFLQDKDGTTPGNYCMIEVKPNWHDSTELLGYYSRLGKAGYQFKKFVKFLVKAKMYPDVPFFVCLDEMNLAPVEQYFAEILSILETRKHPKKEGTDEADMNVIKTGVIIDANYFREYAGIIDKNNQVYSVAKTDRDIYLKLYDIDTEDDIDKEIGKRQDLITDGLTLPDNVFIIGTVNMDDTTHQFSRKVIDRAMTIEMNGGNLRDMFGGSKNLEYCKTEEEQQEWQNAFKQRYVTADEVLEAHPDVAEELKEKLPARLEEINAALKGTPFVVSYRVLNELTIMVGVMLDDNDGNQQLDDIINQAVNNILLMKILPRIEGDAEMFALSKENQTKTGFVNRLEWLKALAPDIETASEKIEPEDGDEQVESTEEEKEQPKEYQQTAKEKIQEMIDRLDAQEFTRFWP